jgi:hypothetical protein
MPDDGHAPRANLPLPRELRDRIYSYLLADVDTRGVRLKDSRSSTNRPVKSHHFHTNVLGVNHAIHDEGPYAGVR